MTDPKGIVGERYRRNAAPHDYVYPASLADGSVSIRTQNGWASVPIDRFEREFTPAPKRPRKKSTS